MNLVTRMAALVGGRATGSSDLDAYMTRHLMDDVPTAAGRAVNEETAMMSVPVHACVRVIAETIASLPFITYRRLAKGKDRAHNHPYYTLLHDRPNPEMTAFEFRETMAGHCLLWGNAYAEIERGAEGVKALWPLRPDRMTVTRNKDDAIVYSYDLPTGQLVPFRFDQIHHWRGFGAGGPTGSSPIALAREAIGMSLAVEEYGARFFGNDSRPGGVLQTSGKLSETAALRLKESWEAAHGGLSKRHRVAVLEEGVSWHQIGIPPEDAQFLQTRRFQVQEIARLFRVPLHLIGDLERATFSNIEHQSIDFVTHTIRPWLVRIEQATQRDVFDLSRSGRDHFAEFLVDALLRGDSKARAEALSIQRQNGIINADEWREIENRNPIPDGSGSRYLVNAAMVPIDQAGRPAAPEAAGE